MSSSADIVRAFYGSLASGDAPGAFALLAPGVTWTEAEGFVYGGTYTGPDAVVAGVFGRLAAEWDGFAAIHEDVVADGAAVAARGWYTGTYKATGAALRARFVHWFTVHDGLITGFEQIVDSALVERCVTGRPAAS